MFLSGQMDSKYRSILLYHDKDIMVHAQVKVGGVVAISTDDKRLEQQCLSLVMAVTLQEVREETQ